MQSMMFTGRLAADPQISDDFAKAVFRLLEKRGVDNAGKDRLVGVNCVSWSKGLNEKVIARGLAQGCEVIVIGAFIDTSYATRDGQERTAKELVINRLTVLDWAEDRDAAAAAGAAPGALALFWTGLKAGLLTFGGAYTAIPYVRTDTVGRGLISDGPFLDGVAFAGVIPAPLVIFCTFVGFVVGGWAGALAMTAGVFLPAFAFSMIFYERLEAVVADPRLHHLLSGVAAAVVGIIAATSLQLGWATLQRVPSIPAALAIFAAAFAVVWFWKSRYAGLVVLAAAALAGWLVFR